MILIDFYIFILTIILFCFVFKVSKWLKNYSRHPKYESISALFTPAETNFYHTLVKVIPEEYRIFGKVRIADVLKPQQHLQGRAWHEAFGKICAKHLDYVICRSDDLEIVCAVELNDRSHLKPDRMERDRFVRTIFRSSKIKLIEVEARRTYDISELKKTFQFLSRSGATQSKKRLAS